MLIIKGVDLSNFVFSFDTIFNNSETFPLLFAFAKSEFNAELLLFVMEVQDLEKKQVQDAKECISVACHIFETFVVVFRLTLVSYVLQNQSTEAKQLKQKFAKQQQEDEKWVITEYATPAKAFEKLKNECLLQIKLDSFPRCKNWLQFLKGKSSEFIQSLGVPKATALKEYKNEDFAEDAPVTDMDFQFAQLMLQDDHTWELIGTTRKNNAVINAFVTTRNYFPNVDWAKQGTILQSYHIVANVCKFSAIFPYNYDTTLKCILSEYCISEFGRIKLKPFGYQSPQDLQKQYPDLIQTHRASFSIVANDVKFGGILQSPRRLGQRFSLQILPDRVISLWKPFIIKDAMPKKHIEMLLYMSITITPVDKDRTNVVLTNVVDLGGYGRNFTLFKLASKARGAQILEAWGAALKAFTKVNPEDYFYRAIMDAK